MRRLVWLLAVFALLWGGWWYFASTSLKNGLEEWLQDRRSAGWQAEVTEIHSGGFPFALTASLLNPQLADPQTGVAFATTALDIEAPVWWPGYVTVLLPSDPLLFAGPEGRRSIEADAARADLRLHPGTALEVQELAFTSGDWSLSAPDGSLMAAQALTLRMAQAEGTPARYDFTLDAPAFEPGNLPRRSLRIPADWPLAFENLTLDATVDFDRPFDRHTVETARPQPRRIDLRLAEAAWGQLLLRVSANLEINGAGLLDGEVSLQARNWQDMLTLAVRSGNLPEQLRPQLESILAALARGGGNPDAIDVTLTLRKGNIFLGFIPLGPAPRLVLR